MRQRRDEAYVLRTHALGEADLIVCLFALRHGKVRGVARAARRSRRRFGGALEPLTRVRLGWTERPGNELGAIESLESERSFAAMQADPAVQAACAVLSEVTEALAREEQADPAVFRLIGATLRALEGGSDVWIVVRYFEFWMLRIHGLLPDLARCASCGRALDAADARFVVPGGGVMDGDCAGAAGGSARRLGSAALRFLADARSGPPEHVVVSPRTVRPGGVLEALLRGTLEGFVEKRFRSYRHLARACPAPAEEAAP